MWLVLGGSGRVRGGTLGRRATPLSALASCLGLGEHLVLGHLVPSASLPVSQGPASSRYVTHHVQPCHGISILGARGLPPPPCQDDVGSPTGMGSQSRPQGTLQGFGYSKDPGHTGG